MKTIKLFFLLAPAFFACAGLHAQVTIGGLTEPATGAILDLNSSVRGGLLLSNLAITDLDMIPTGSNIFSGVSPDSLDVNWGLRGALVYNTDPATVPGIYVWTGRYWMPVNETEADEVELEVDSILFTIHTTDDDVYAIPTSGMLNLANHAYDWDITVDGQPIATEACPNGRCIGTSSMSGANANGIQLSGLSSGDHQIKITPHGGAAPGWGNAFGYCGNVTGTLITVGANAVTNRQKLISIDAPLSTLAFAPKTDESLTNADFMFAGVFSGCPSLTDPAVILDNYKLPATVTNLSYFLGGIHLINDALTDPIDLKPLENWLKNNNSIKNLSYFLAGVHMLNNALTDPIVLTPLKDWFIGNESIENLSNFLYSTHYSNPSLNAPIALTSLSGWFIGNESIENLSSFLFDTHYGDNSLNAPINLTPLSGWFNGNGSIKSLSSFLYSTHYNNSSLNAPVDLTPLSSWFSNNRPIDYLSDFLYATHSGNTSLTLSGQRIFPNWIKTMQQSGASILNVSGTFSYTFHLSSGKEKSGDSEPKFQDSTVLSSLGNPSSLKHTYQGRTGITNTAISVNWK